jgi:ABC-type lipoprotein export system ATPase subunit
MNRDNVLEILDELHSEGLTVVVVTHDSQVSKRASSVLQMSDGVVRLV